MARSRLPTEFGFTTPSYLPPERPRPTWRTLLLGALLTLIPVVGPGLSVVYIDRRDAPGTFDAISALKTAVIQLVAIALLALLAWLVLGVALGVTVELNARFNLSWG